MMLTPQVHDHHETEVAPPLQAGDHGHLGLDLDHLRHPGHPDTSLLHHSQLRGGHGVTEADLHHDLAGWRSQVGLIVSDRQRRRNDFYIMGLSETMSLPCSVSALDHYYQVGYIKTQYRKIRV